MHALDDTDRRLLRLLQDDPELTASALAARVGARRRPLPAADRAARSATASSSAAPSTSTGARSASRCGSSCASPSTRPHANAFDAFLAAARGLPEVIAIETLLGRVDVRMDVIARDLAHYQEIYRDRILALPHIAEIEALMLVSELKNSERLPL